MTRIRVSWDEEFSDLMRSLKDKYGEEIFTLDGIGRQLDTHYFSKNFFNNQNATADVSVDANANVVAKTSIEYNFEMPKPLKRYNSYFLIWKELRKAYDLQTANEIIESQLTGDMYINDFTDVASPYSYHGDTTIILKHPENTQAITLKELYDKYQDRAVTKKDWTEIDTTDLNLKVFEKGVYVDITRVVRHKNTRPLIGIRLANSLTLRVTDDHPCVLHDDREIPARDVLRGDVLKDCRNGMRVQELSKIEAPEYVYDITTSTGFFATCGIIVHNCFNYSTYDIAMEGLNGISKRLHVGPPKSLSTFLRQVEQFMVVAANSTLGATGFADILIVGSKFVDKIIETGKDGHVTIPDVKTYVREKLTEFVYTVNWEFRGNQCNAVDTEVLTPEGWKDYQTLQVKDLIYTWRDGKLHEDNTVEAINVYDVDGYLHLYSGRAMHQLVTDNHRVLCSFAGEKPSLHESSEIFNKHATVTIPVAAECEHPEYDIEDDDLDAAVFFLTDGCIDASSPTRLPRLTWCKSDTRYGIDHFLGIMQRAGIEPYHRVQHSDDFRSDVQVFRLSGRDSAQYLDLIEGTKKRLPSWMKYLSKNQARRVLDLWSKTDGYRADFILQADTPEVAAGLQTLALIAGYSSREYQQLISANKNPTRFVRIYEATERTATPYRVRYKGKVWCPTTKDGVIVCRRNGYVFITGNSPFSNVSIYDGTFLDSLCPDYGANKETVKMMQSIFVDVMNSEMKRTPLTFPVTTACFAIDENKVIKDEEFLKFIAEANKEFGFINLYNGSTATLSSCCRLRSERKSEYFNSFGAGSTKIGSLGVVTANLPRMAYLARGDEEKFLELVHDLFIKARRINACKRRLIKKRIELGAAPLYTSGYMDLKKQYSTFGIVGINEAVQLLGKDILTKEGQDLVVRLLDKISEWIDEAEKEEHAPHNVEQVPAESSAVKLAKKDKMLGYDIGVPLYSNQFIPLITKADMFDRLRLQGMFDSKLSGGAIAHINVGTPIESTETIVNLMKYAAKQGVVYWAINYKLNCCKNKHTWVGTDMCPTCGEMWDSQITRVVGFFTTVKNWNPTRRNEDWPNRQFYEEEHLQVRDQQQ